MSRRKAEKIGENMNNGYVETDPTGRYGRFAEVLGKGAMKTVYRAFDERNGTEVAWNQAKLSDIVRSSDALQRMYSEVHLLSSLNHESVITFHTSWIDVGSRTFNFITELFTSGTLREYRLRYPRVDLRAIKSWARQILDGLVYLHSHNPPVIHRDIKCDNIFVNGHLGQVKIGDLGLAAVLKGSQSAHSVIGTPEFMAPELYEEDYNELVDIYSFGMCMLEMLTSEYPYSECSNPAQIYKKVISGKLPEGYHKIKDPEAKRFIGRCLDTASRRSSAEELLDDPFLSLDDDVSIRRPKSFLSSSSMPIIGRNNNNHDIQLNDDFEPEQEHQVEKTDMTITGKLNPEDDTIFLKVQIGVKNSHPKNIYFPFDIMADTPIDVANEMVKDLELTDWDPLEIADMIGQEIKILVPDWNPDNGVDNEPEEYEEDERESNHNPFYCVSPTGSSSHGSLYGVGPSSSSHGPFCHGWQDDLYTDDDESSTHSGKYSSMTYYSGIEPEPKPDSISSPSKKEAQPKSPHKSTRFCEKTSVDKCLSNQPHKHCHFGPDNSSVNPGDNRGRKMTIDKRRLLRNRSMVDIRSQLLHKTLVEELNKRLFKTVGSVENIGFQDPCIDPSVSLRREGSSSSSSSRANQRKGKKNLG
ncbi:hypothetical protein LUZ60_015430 [Juncus effusus]|nr:hypothetical protein LUZ60_015430 [Juncus effusus]